MTNGERRERREARRRKAANLLGLFLEDLLLLAGSGCFTAAAALAAGCAAALATAGACLTVYALVVARSAGRR